MELVRGSIARALLVSGEWRAERAETSGVWLLSNDTQTVLDAIDLRNGGPDTLMLRNDGRLRLSHGTVFGEPGDEVWLEGLRVGRLTPVRSVQPQSSQVRAMSSE